MNATFTRTLLHLLCPVLAMGMAGCTDGLLRVTYSGIKPSYPLPLGNKDPVGIHGNVDPSVRVESTTPILKWDAKEGIRNYDVAVWECPTRYLTGMFAAELGQQVFFSSGVQGLSVKVTPPLKSKKRYYWSVRPSGTELWSTYDIYDPMAYATLQHTRSSKGQYFKFSTP